MLEDICDRGSGWVGVADSSVDDMQSNVSEDCGGSSSCDCGCHCRDRCAVVVAVVDSCGPTEKPYASWLVKTLNNSVVVVMVVVVVQIFIVARLFIFLAFSFV